MKKINRIISLLALLTVILVSCKKEESLTLPSFQAHFANTYIGTYFVEDTGTSFTIPVGLTQKASSTTNVNVKIVSVTGASVGNQFSISTTTAIFQPGQSIDTSIKVRAKFSVYDTTGTLGKGRRDTILFVIEKTGSVLPSDYNDTFKLIIRGQCDPGIIESQTLQSLIGAYTATDYDGTNYFGPYVDSLTRYRELTPTSAEFRISSLFHDQTSSIPGRNIPAVFDWSNGSGLLGAVSIRDGFVLSGMKGSDFGYGSTIAANWNVIISNGSNGGFFDPCNNKVDITYKLGLQDPTGAQTYPDILGEYQTTMLKK